MIELIKENPSIIQKIIKNKETINKNNIYDQILTDIQDEINMITSDESEYELDFDTLRSYDEELYKMLQ